MAEFETCYTVTEVTQILKRSKPTVYAYLKSGLLRAKKSDPSKPNSKYIITESALREFISAGVPDGYYQQLYPRKHKGNDTPDGTDNT